MAHKLNKITQMRVVSFFPGFSIGWITIYRLSDLLTTLDAVAGGRHIRALWMAQASPDGVDRPPQHSNLNVVQLYRLR